MQRIFIYLPKYPRIRKSLKELLTR